MKTIEERGGNFAANYEVLDDNGRRKNECEIARESYISGAKDEHELLTRWHDPKEVLPEYYKVVEVKWYDSGQIRISTAWLSAGDAGGYLWTIEGTSRLINVKNILGWREIHE